MTRGDLTAVKWGHDKVEYEASAVCDLAAKSGMVEVVQWIVDQNSRLEVALRLEDSGDLRAICWTDRSYTGWTRRQLAVVEEIGFFENHSIVSRAPDGTLAPPQFGLAEPFAERGDIARLEQILSLPNGTQYFSQKTIDCAAAHGQLATVQWLQPVRDWRWPRALHDAVINGHLDTVKWIFPLAAPHTSEMLTDAVLSGHVEIVRWYVSQGALKWENVTQDLWPSALRSCSVEMLQYVAYELRVPFHRNIGRGKADLATIKYLAEHLRLLLPRSKQHDYPNLLARCVGQDGTIDALDYAARELGERIPTLFSWASDKPNSISLLSFLYDDAKLRSTQDGSRLHDLLSLSAISTSNLVFRGNDDVAIWLWENVPEIDPDHLHWAEELELDEHWSWGPDRLTHQAKLQRLLKIVLCWLRYRPQHCCYIPWLPECAIRTSSFEAFELLKAIGHPQLFTAKTRDLILTHSRSAHFMSTLLNRNWRLFSTQIVSWAAKYSQIPLLVMISKRLADESSPMAMRMHVTNVIVRAAAICGQTEVLQWSRDEGSRTLGVAEDSGFRNVAPIASRFGHLNVLIWLNQQGLLLGTRIPLLVAQAARYGQLSCLRWIINTFHVQDSAVLTRALRVAVERAHVDVVELLLSSSYAVELSTADRIKIRALRLEAQWKPFERERERESIQFQRL